jgi:hypothetical protein
MGEYFGLADGDDGPGDDTDEVPETSFPVRATAEVMHSPLVGFFSAPLHRRIPVRRSTVVLLVGFLGFGSLLYLHPPRTSTTPSTPPTTDNPISVITGTPGSTTTRPVVTPTTGEGSPPSTSVHRSTTTTSHPSTTTTGTPSSTTTTTSAGKAPATTTTTVGVTTTTTTP